MAIYYKAKTSNDVKQNVQYAGPHLVDSGVPGVAAYYGEAVITPEASLLSSNDNVASLGGDRVFVVNNANNPIVTSGIAGSTGSSTLTASEAHIGQVGGTSVRKSASFTRPADTIIYSGNDLVGNSTVSGVMIPLEFADFTRTAGNTGYIVGARLSTNKVNITPSWRVHLFNNSGATIATDNDYWKGLYADESKRLGHFDLGSMSSPRNELFSDMSRVVNMDLTHHFQAASGTRSIYAVLETLTSFTPNSAQQFTLTLDAELD